MDLQSNGNTAGKKYEPSMDELGTEIDRIMRVRDIILAADTFQEMCDDLNKYGVTKPLHFLQRFAQLFDPGREIATYTKG